MGKIGFGYGSEWHLLHWLAYHRDEFNGVIEQAILSPSQTFGDKYTFAYPNPLPQSPSTITWLDFPWTGDDLVMNERREWEGIEFVSDPSIVTAWSSFWPRPRKGVGKQQCWDAVAKRLLGAQEEWILVEAKAHEGELRGKGCQAKGASRSLIENTLLNTMSTLAVPTQFKDAWLGPYYQYANRLAALYFLQQQGISARLVNVYFTKEVHRGWACPQNASGWDKALDDLYTALGLHSRKSAHSAGLLSKVHEVFLPVHK